MPSPCRVCIHESRAAIEQAILSGKPASQIAKNFGFTYTTRKAGKVMGDHKVITRHRDECMREAYDRSQADRDAITGNAMAARIAYLDEQVDHVIQVARQGETVMFDGVPLLNDDGTPVKRYDERLLLAAVRTARMNVEVMAKLSGAIPEGKSEELDAMRDLLKSPEARKLLAALDALDVQKDASESRSGD
jgi:hypothetical protein